LADNPALLAAVGTGRPIVPLYVLDQETDGVRALGGAGRWWLYHALQDLESALADIGLPLIRRRGPAGDRVLEIARTIGAGRIHWNRLYEPAAVERDKRIKSLSAEQGIEVESYCAGSLWEPFNIRTKTGRPYQVFSRYWDACRAAPRPPRPRPAPLEALAADSTLRNESLRSWNLLPRKPDWAGGLRETWTPTMAGVQTRLDRFLTDAANRYERDRDLPGSHGTSALSPYLRFGQIGPRQVWHQVEAATVAGAVTTNAAETFLRELGWREFCTQLLFHHPAMSTENLRTQFDAFPWRNDDDAFEAWSRGRTGYPIVDAGMRQLWRTGWMHNRVRMITASFLVKDLLIDWRHGEAWFWDTLVDADPASNVANWQWVAGSGADAAPYFRIFNPVRQGEKFDRAGEYVRRWVPEIAKLPDRYVHAPWTAPAGVLDEAGIRLGETYPAPIVDHAVARDRALAAFEKTKKWA